jgi:octaprenyl-diphosphate synthase
MSELEGAPAAPYEPRGVDAAPLLSQLGTVCDERGAIPVSARLVALREFLNGDLEAVDEELSRIEALDTPLHQSAHHLLECGGKRLRPMCVALAARLGTGFSATAQDLAVAAELVHNATLLHDDVVDVGELRRGAPAARVIYGNAASIFAGDWLLVHALTRVRRAGLPDVLDRMLAVLGEMLHAEALQLARRGTVPSDEVAYFQIIEGKTASLFEWAMMAGARAGGLEAPMCASLGTFGRKLGVAFQLVDDVLDVDGEEGELGKSMLSDLREGKLTYPLLLAVREEPSLAEEITHAAGGAAPQLPAETMRRVLAAMRRSGAVTLTKELADRHAAEAIDHLSALAPSRGKEALVSVAYAVAHRTR